jgi:hypothetical protein
MKLFALILAIFGSTVSMAGDADPVVIRKSPAACTLFFKGVRPKDVEAFALEDFLMKPLNNIYSVMNLPNLTPQQIIENFENANIRGSGFSLEGTFAAVEAANPEVFSVLRADAELLENGMGDYGLQTEIYDFVKDLVKTDPTLKDALTPELKGMFSGRIDYARDAFLVNEKRWGWAEGKGNIYKEILDAVAKNKPIVKKRELKRRLLKWASAKLRGIHEQMELGLATSEERSKLAKSGKKELKFLDPDKIEEGTHKGKREVRAVKSMFAEFDGLFYLDENLKISGVTLEDAKKRPILNASGAEQGKRAVGISQDGYYLMDQVVRKLDKLKSGDGMKENVYTVLKNSRYADDEATSLMTALVPKGASSADPFKETHDATRDLFRTVVDSKAFLQMADQLDEAAKEFK